MRVPWHPLMHCVFPALQLLRAWLSAWQVSSTLSLF